MFVDGFAELEMLPALSARPITEPKSFTKFSGASAQPVALLGVAFDKVTLQDSVRRIEEMIDCQEPQYVVTANVDFLVQARRDLELQRILLNAPLVLCDGTPLVWASRLLRNPLPERVAGADLVPELIRVAAEKNYRLFFLGTTDEANTRAIAKLHAQFPNLEINHYSPPFRPLLEMDDDEIIRRIRAAEPDLLFVAFGCPKAEKWIAMHYRELGVPVCIGVGATIDFLSGRVKRAPVWMQRGGVEWIFRLCQEPRRLFKRYATDLVSFGGLILQQWWSTKGAAGAKGAPARSLVVLSERAWLRVEASPCFDRDSVQSDAGLWSEIGAGERHCLVEASGVKVVDSTGLGLLVHLQKQLRGNGQQLVLLSPSTPLLAAIKAVGLETFFEVASDAVEARELIAARRQEQCAVVENDLTAPLAWSGEITSTTAHQIRAQTSAALRRGNLTSGSRIIDLAAVRFMDSGGAKVLLETVELARQCGVRLCFSNPSEPVRNVLQISSLEHLLKPAA